MKKLNKVIASALMGVALVSCNDLDTVYEGYYVTSETKADVLEINPERAVAGVTGITAVMNRFGVTLGTDAQDDYGYASVMLKLDCMTADMNSRNAGYNWNLYEVAWNNVVPANDFTLMIWRNEYDMIYTSNAVLSTIPADTEVELLKVFRAQALGFRAFNYWVLAQLYQFNYQNNKEKPCVPLITAENAEEAALNGAPRASVEDVYALIMGDLNEAIEKAESTNINIATYVPDKPRRMLYLDALYGLRARVNLTMGNFAEAAADAKKAIALSTATPLTIEECSKPGFKSISEHNWMWGIAVAETDRPVTTRICNNPSFLCSFAYGYTMNGVWKGIATDLWDNIPISDVRKGWWLDDNFESPILTPEQQEYLLSYGTGTVAESTSKTLIEHTNVKFDSYNSVLNQNVNANDIPLMRIEEMYYIAVEGLAMSNQVGEAVQMLTDFETTYRNPNFICTATSPEDVQEVVWNKRRVELWGEGLAYFDVMRLNKGVDRTGSGCYSSFRYNIPAGDPIMLQQIPEHEMIANKALSQQAEEGTPAGNNKQGVRPTPVR